MHIKTKRNANVQASVVVEKAHQASFVKAVKAIAITAYWRRDGTGNAALPLHTTGPIEEGGQMSSGIVS